MAYRDADDWDEEDRWPWWRAILGIVIVTFLALASGLVNPHPQPYLPVEAGLRVAATIFLFYGLLWFTAVRRAHLAWKLIGFVLIVAAALLIVSNGTIRERLKMGDMAGLSRELANLREGGTLKARTDDGSVAATIREMAIEMQADQRAYLKEIDEAGANALASPAGLRARPDVLKNCDRIAALDATVLRYRSIWSGRIDSTRAALVNKHGATQPELADFDAGAAGGRANAERLWELERQNMKDTAAACRVLARRHWQQGTGGVDYAFTSQRDLDEYRDLVARSQANAAEIEPFADGEYRADAAGGDANRALGSVLT